MNAELAAQLAKALLAGELSLEEFVGQATALGVADVGDAQLDLDRRRRCGFAEVVFGQGKSVEALERIVAALLQDNVDVLVTRVSAEQAAAIGRRFPAARHNAIGRTLRIPPPMTSGVNQASETAAKAGRRGRVAVVSAGTSDAPVAEEARDTAQWMGADVVLIQDVGVAGPQRLIARLPEIVTADAVVVVAGMEAALASVVGGHVACPVIAVPTSVGYGASFGGMAALLGMLNSCAANVSVVNIDAGFKGGYVAGLIAQRAVRPE
ncbi:MAG: nickel pincer cofactor biosynthesis protein LarB [Pirellulales bacterium]